MASYIWAGPYSEQVENKRWTRNLISLLTKKNLIIFFFDNSNLISWPKIFWFVEDLRSVLCIINDQKKEEVYNRECNHALWSIYDLQLICQYMLSFAFLWSWAVHISMLNLWILWLRIISTNLPLTKMIKLKGCKIIL